MSNKSVSDFVASTMDAVLKSASHQSLFGNTYKFASDQNLAKDTMCAVHGKHDSCSSDSSNADDNDVRHQYDSSDESTDTDSNSVEDESTEEDMSCAIDDELESSAFDVAIDGLLTASAALDSVGLERGSSLSLKLASLVVEAKKKEKEKKKKEKDSKSTSSKDSKKKDSKKTDNNDARAKKKPASSSSSSSKKDSKTSKDSKSTSSSSKKPNPFVKKK